MDREQAVAAAMLDVHRQFILDYGALWSKGGATEQAELLHTWVRALEDAGADAAGVRRAHQKVKSDPQYDRFPPKVREFVRFAQEAAHDEEALTNSVEQLHRRFGHRYAGAWTRRDAMEERERARYWAQALARFGVTPGEVAMGERAIESCGQFQARAPTMDQFIDLCLVERLGEEIPSVEEALRLASSASGAAHALVQEARRQVGSHELRTRPSEVVRGEFRRVYMGLRSRYLRGEICLESDAGGEPPQKAPAFDAVDEGSLVETLDDLIARFSGRQP